MAYESPPAKGTGIGRVRGLGSAHRGAHHWLMMQFTSAASLVTCAYLVFSLLLLPDFSYDTVREWLSGVVPSLVIGLLIVGVFWHAKMGLETMIEDYVHRPASKFATLLALNLAFVAGGAFGLLSLVRIVAAVVGEQAAAEAAAQVQQEIGRALQGMMGGGMPQ